MSKKPNQLSTEAITEIIEKIKESTTIENDKIIRSGWGDYEYYLGTIADGLYIGEQTATELFNEKGFSRTTLIKQINETLKDLILADKDYEKIIKKQINMFLNKKHLKTTHYYIYPLNANFSRVNFPKEINLLNKRIVALTYTEFRKSKYYCSKMIDLLISHLGICTIYQKPIPPNANKPTTSYCSKSKFDYTKYTYFILSHKGPDERYSNELCTELFEVILSIINLGQHFNSRTWRSGITTSATSTTRFPSMIFRLNNRKKFEHELFFKNARPFDDIVNITEFKNNKITFFLEQITKLKIKNELTELIFKNLKSYNAALIEPDKGISCHKFWTAIEKVIQIDDSVKFINTILSILNNPPKYFKTKIETLKHKRNLYVHELNNQFTDPDKDLLQQLSEQVFIFLLNNLKEIHDKEDLKLLYTTASKTKEQLKKEIKLIKYVNKEKKYKLRIN